MLGHIFRGGSLLNVGNSREEGEGLLCRDRMLISLVCLFVDLLLFLKCLDILELTEGGLEDWEFSCCEKVYLRLRKTQ